MWNRCTSARVPKLQYMWYHIFFTKINELSEDWRKSCFSNGCLCLNKPVEAGSTKICFNQQMVLASYFGHILCKGELQILTIVTICWWYRHQDQINQVVYVADPCPGAVFLAIPQARAKFHHGSLKFSSPVVGLTCRWPYNFIN